ncbi:hypothetical protein [Mycolicibacterium sp.]|uniref:hypothetical protein n=1 Tax=Mycolicibacterium sp. TaxID=2320850 RepID=UPI003D0A7905
MALALTHAEAQARIDQVHQARDEAVNLLKHIADSQEEMLRKFWEGDSASLYGKTAEQRREDFTQLISLLDQTVAEGDSHINAVASADQG